MWSKVLETICKYIIFQFGKIENKPFSLKKSEYLFTKKKYNGCYNGWLPLCHLCHLRHRLRNFLFRTKVMFRSQDIQVLVLLTIPWFAKSVTSNSVQTGCIFEYIFQGQKIRFFWCTKVRAPQIKFRRTLRTS